MNKTACASNQANGNKPKYEVGEKVLCYHGPLLYEAKCLKVTTMNKIIKYMVHYNGWNKNWDEWVVSSRLLKHNAENLAKQAELVKKHTKDSFPKLRGRRESIIRTPRASVHREINLNNLKARATRSCVVTLNDINDKRGLDVDVKSDVKMEVDAVEVKKEEVEDVVAPEKTVDEVTDPPKEADVVEMDCSQETEEKEEKETPKLKGKPKGRPVKGKKIIKKPEIVKTIVNEEETEVKTVESVKETEKKVDVGPFLSRRDVPIGVAVDIKIPEDLCKWLVDDNDYILRQRLLCVLPAETTVDQILKDFYAYKKKTDEAARVKGFCIGLRNYFNIMLGKQLLYKFERCQYGEILRDLPKHKAMSEVYGVTHLLRLFCDMGPIIAQYSTQTDDANVQTLINDVNDLIQYIDDNKVDLLKYSNYRYAPRWYYRLFYSNN